MHLLKDALLLNKGLILLVAVESKQCEDMQVPEDYIKGLILLEYYGMLLLVFSIKV